MRNPMVSGSANAANRGSAADITKSAANTQCQEALSSTAPPSDGATTGATPNTSISRESTVAATDSDDRDRDLFEDLQWEPTK